MNVRPVVPCVVSCTAGESQPHTRSCQKNRVRILTDKLQEVTEAAREREQRLDHDLTYLLAVAHEVSDGEASRTALRVAVDQIRLGVFHIAVAPSAVAQKPRGEGV